MRMGRPPITGETKAYIMHARLDNACGAMLDEMAAETGKSRVQLIEESVRQLYSSFVIGKKRKEEK